MAGTDYGDSLRSTLDAARKQILDLGQTTTTTRQQAALTLGHAEQALSVAENSLHRNQGDLTIAYLINGMAVQGGALIQSADQLAGLAKTSADSATSSLGVATTSIKSLAGAFDTLAGSIAGVNAVASNDDFGSAMARSAKKSEDAANAADDTVERLKAASLSASIQAAKSIAASAATSVTAVGVELQDLVDRAAALLVAAQQRVSDSMKQRAAASQVERAAQTTYHQTKLDSEALDDGTTNLDALLNGGLVVTAVPATAPPATTPPSTTAPRGAQPAPVTTTPTTPPAGPPSLTASYSVVGTANDRCYFFAVPDADAPGFAYNDAKTAVIDAQLKVPAVGWSPTVAAPSAAPPGSAPTTTQTYTVSILTSRTNAGDTPDTPKEVPIAVGQSYQVFAYRVPPEGPYATNASDLSYPSRTTPVMKPIANLAAFQATWAAPSGAPVSPLPSVLVTAPLDPAKTILEYRAFALLEDVYEAIKDDAAFLTGMFSASSYKTLSPSEVQGGTAFTYHEGDTDAYGDILTAGTNYEVLVMIVPRDTDTTASALLLAQPPPPKTDTSSGPSGSGPGQPAPSGGPSTRTAATASKPTPEVTTPTPAPTPSGTGAK